MHHEQTKIVNAIIASLETGVLPWRKQYEASASRRGLPYNAISGKAYNGVNVIALLMKGYPIDGGWLTYKQAIAAGGNVRKGERSTVIFYYQKALDNKRTAENGKDTFYLLAKSYLVFHRSQCDNLDPKKLFQFPNAPAPVVTDGLRNIEADTFVANTGASINIKSDGYACYVPSIDKIFIHAIEQYVSPDAYYSTLFHELAHWTGPRLARNQSTNKNAKAYGYEELIAELCACFTLPQFGMNNVENSEKYLNGWIKILRETPQSLMTVASAASQANAFLNAFQPSSDAVEPDETEGATELAA